MRKPLIAGNWKMHKTINEAIQLVNDIKRKFSDFEKVDIVVCPPFTALNSVYEIIMDTKIKLGAQNMFYELEGAYTGEISPVQLRDAGCQYVIIGHSERRKYFKEDDALINKKVRTAIKEGLIPILCVGETLQEREEGKTIEVIETQLSGGLRELSLEDMQKVVIAYEPVWAIGTGKTATPQQAEEVHRFIREWIKDKFSSPLAENLRILYGGSIKPTNIADLMKEEDVDGGLVGGASLEADSFCKIIENSCNV